MATKFYKIVFTFLIGFSGLMMSSHLKAADVVLSKDTVFTVSKLLKDDSYFCNAAQQIEAEKNEKNRNQLFQRLLDDATYIYCLQEDLAWINMDAIRLAFADMKQVKSYNFAKYQPLLDELEQLVRKGFNGIYKLDKQAVSDAEKALANKRAVLL